MRNILFVPLLTLMFACPSGQSLDKSARDAAAGLGGAVTAAQAQNLAACKADPSTATCTTITRGVNGQNALITALETYCGWPVNSLPPDTTVQCVPVASYADALKAAIANANQLVTEVKGTVKP